VDDRNGSIDAYMDDSPIVEYVRTTMDATCRLRLVRSGFGEDAYGIGLPKHSNLKVGRCLHSIPPSRHVIEFHRASGWAAFVCRLRLCNLYSVPALPVSLERPTGCFCN